MSDDWASDTEEGFGDFAVPEVCLPDPPPKPAPAPPPANAWAAPSSSDARLANRLRHEAANQRGSVRSLASQDPRRLNSGPRLGGPAPGFPSPRFSPNAPSNGSVTTTLYVSRLPSNTHEGEIASFFSHCGVARTDVNLMRYSDTGNIKAALVTTRGDANRDSALAMNNVKLCGRPVQVKIEGESAPAPGMAPRRQPSSPASAPAGSTTTLYVFHLPFDTSEVEIASLFRHCAVTPADVHLTRHNDTGNIKAALVTIRGEENLSAGLAVDGAKLSGRPVHVKVDGDRRGSGAGQRERSGYGFGSKDRRMEAMPSSSPHGGQRDSTWSSGWTERSGGGGFDQSSRGERGVEGRSAGASRGAGVTPRGASEQREDPTIPTGPPPAGRKKLVLKPRTKPPPVLEVDTRAIDGVKPSVPSSVSQPRHRFENSDPSKNLAMRQNSGPRVTAPLSEGADPNPKEVTPADPKVEKWTTPKDATAKTQGERWSSAKEGAPQKASGTAQGSNKKDDDSKKRPVLLNTFAALEVNDADA